MRLACLALVVSILALAPPASLAAEKPPRNAVGLHEEIDPEDGAQLIAALSGSWYYPTDNLGQVSKDAPKKPNHPWEDLGDAFCYFLCGIMPELNQRPRKTLGWQTPADKLAAIVASTS